MYPAYKPIEKHIKCEEVKATFPPQHQGCQPGLEYLIFPRPISETPYYLENR
ncbi:MAG TPA: NAD(P)-dependent oxidoreductase, partial [Clostridium sp.]|nr:NAD(P)-dependent oxidoreductase [Clostridium sp.]